jgi:putative transposase
MLMNAMKPKNIRHLNEPGHAHELTFSCFHGKRFLKSDIASRIFIDAVNAARISCSFKVIAYIIMPNHIHLLILPQNDEYQISKILSAIKLRVSLRISARYRKNTGKLLGRFWQRGGGYDRNIISKDAVISSINYIHNNPVRKGLGIRPEDWKWSSAGFYAGSGDGPMKIDNEVLGGLI